MKFRPKFHLKISISKKSFYIISFLFILIIILFTGFFLYQFVYKSIISSDEISVKRQKVAPESFNKDAFEKIILNIQSKKNSRQNNEIGKISNFFLENRIASSTAQILPDKNTENINTAPSPKSTENIVNE